LFFWDGRATSLEEQALMPVIDPIEMHNTWPEAITSLQNTGNYPGLFNDAFGTDIIDSILVSKALAQFERTLISGNSPYDKKIAGNPSTYSISEQELIIIGEGVFNSESKGGCFHCHGNKYSPLFYDNLFHNNGLDVFPTDSGQAAITGNIADMGKFKTPTVRNLLFTAPYMHDGRFNTIEEVVNHYNTGIKKSIFLDPEIHIDSNGGPLLTQYEVKALAFFLKTLTDSSFITNPDFQDPN
jgi:cytochrome c peroxidase